MERLEPKPKSISRAQKWTDSVEEAYRFQCAGYRDEMEYKFFQKAKTTQLTLLYCVVDKIKNKQCTCVKLKI
uniref:Uncharacterized protein n=1 Tax=Octopus bimaculoides TaxID=37653 RepID=A0A0L8HWL0_OCTBM